MKTKQQGYIALMTVLIVMSVVLTIVTTVSFLAIGEAQSSLTLYKGESALNFVEGCTEDTLLKIRANSGLSGTFTFSRPEGTCSTTVVSKVGLVWTVDVTTLDTLYNRTIRIVFNRNPTGIVLTSWTEQ